jgi:hypothetical protein
VSLLANDHELGESDLSLWDRKTPRVAGSQGLLHSWGPKDAVQGGTQANEWGQPGTGVDLGKEKDLKTPWSVRKKDGQMLFPVCRRPLHGTATSALG